MTEEVLRPRKRHRGEAIWSIIWNLIFLYIINKVPDWDLPFINEHYATVLWIFNMSIILQILGWLIILFLDFHWLWHLIRAILDVVGLVVFLVLFFLYPFDFSGIPGWTWLDLVLPVVFVIGMVASGIGVVVHLFKLIFRSGT